MNVLHSRSLPPKGCIPVTFGNDYVLPFSEVIDWRRASVRVWSRRPDGIMATLTEHPDSLITETREQVRCTFQLLQLGGALQMVSPPSLPLPQVEFLYRRFFSSISAIAMTTLDILNERVFPTSARGYEVYHTLTMPASLMVIVPSCTCSGGTTTSMSLA